MKKMSFLLLALAAFFTACNDNVNTTIAPAPAVVPPVVAASSKPLSPPIKAVLSQPTIGAMQQAYNKLTDADKYSLWEQKYATILKNDKDRFTGEQQNIVLEFQIYLTSGIIQKMKTDPKAADSIEKRMKIFEKSYSSKQLFFLSECPYFTDTFSIVNIGQNSHLPAQ
jgi:hypothetical protein